jgi:DNA polymerase-3 subunit alpha
VNVYGELHAHSTWSLLDGVGSAEAGAQRAADLGHPFKVMTEHAVLSGVDHHMDACRDVGIQALVGLEAYYRRQRVSNVQIEAMRKNGEDVERFFEYFHMVLIAKDVRGWRSLKLLSSQSFRDGFYRKPCIDDELLDRWHEGLIASTSCVSGYIPRAILRGDDTAVREHAADLDRWFGEDWYFEIQPHGFEDLQIVNREAVSLAQSLGRPVVATRDAHAPDDTWVETQHVSVMMRLKGSMVREARKEHEADEKYDLRIADTAYIASEDQTREDFQRHHPGLDARVVDEAISNTGWVASRCVPWLMDRTPKMPRYCDSYEDDDAELRRRVFAGLERRGHADKPNYVAAVEKELLLYRERNFSAFFLWVDEMIRWLRSPDGLPPCAWDPHPNPAKTPEKVGLGRGSAGGCRVAYALGITLMNPENYDLSFERFLNPDRGGMPDIDVDLTSRGAELAKEWFKRRKGPDKVYDMIAHSTFGAREALRRVGMVYAPTDKVELREWHARMNALTKNIPDDETGLDLDSLRAHIPALAEFAENQPKVFAHAARLQDGNSKITEHASAIVISDMPLDEIVPVMKKSAKDDYLVTAFGNSAEKETISDLGLLKLDLLVVVALARQAYAEQLVARVHGVDLNLDLLPALEHPDAADPGAMEIFCLGAKNGIFQWDGKSNMASLTKRIKPTTISHLAAANAGVRPGVSQHIESYVRRRHGEVFDYWDPAVAPALKETFGLPLYQEQIMAIFQLLGGYTAGEADIVRRIMGKYYRIKGGVAAEMLATHRSRFVENAALACQGGRSMAEMIWDFCGSSSEYLFNACLAGSTMVEKDGPGKHGGSKMVSIAELYAIQEGPRTPMQMKLRSKGLMIMQMSGDGRMRPGRMKQIHYNGSAEVFDVTTACGRSVRVTANHRLLSTGGYVRVDEIIVGSTELVTMGEREHYQRKGHENERARGVSYDGSGFREGEQNVAWIDGRTALLEKAKSDVAQRSDGVCEECSKPHDGRLHGMEFSHQRSLEQCGGRYDVYHSAANIKHLCNSCHKHLDYAKGERVRRWARGIPSSSSVVVSVEPAGTWAVFDVEMDTPEHNFVANGIVSHNSHAKAYSLIAHADAYLKAHYPDAFYASLLTFPPAGVKKPENRSAFYERNVREARSFNIDILPPDVNESDENFTIRGDAVRFGLKGIKGLGPAMVADVLNNRPFASLEDMGAKLTACNAAGRHALAQAGALDRFDARANLTPDERASNEEDRIGVALSGEDKLAPVREGLRALIHTADEVEAAPNGQALVVGGEIVYGNETNTKMGIPGLKLTIAFGADEYKVSIPPWDYDASNSKGKQLRELIASDAPVVVRGYRDVEYDCVACDEIKAASEVLKMMEVTA